LGLDKQCSFVELKYLGHANLQRCEFLLKMGEGIDRDAFRVHFQFISSGLGTNILGIRKIIIVRQKGRLDHTLKQTKKMKRKQHIQRCKCTYTSIVTNH
jgi:hypothetical protein